MIFRGEVFSEFLSAIKSPEGVIFENPGFSKEISHKLHQKVLVAKDNQELHPDCLLFCTSGTTSGEPRWVKHTNQTLLGSAQVAAKFFGLKAHDIWALALPIFHVGGLGVLARSEVTGAGVAIFDFEGSGLRALPSSYRPRWDAEKFYRFLNKTQATVTSLVPTQVNDLVSFGERAPESLRCVVVGGDKIPQEVFEAAHNNGWPLMRTYGMTETGSLFAAEEGSPVGKQEPVFVPLPGWSLEGGNGAETRVRGPGLFRGYLGTSERVDNEKGFLIPDYLKIEARESESCRPRFKVVGRGEDVFKVLGEWVNLHDLSQRISKNLKIDTHKIFLIALPDERRGRKIFLVSEESFQEKLDYLNQTLSPWERIKACVKIEKMPRNSLGKVDQGVLKQLILSNL